MHTKIIQRFNNGVFFFFFFFPSDSPTELLQPLFFFHLASWGLQGQLVCPTYKGLCDPCPVKMVEVSRVECSVRCLFVGAEVINLGRWRRDSREFSFFLLEKPEPSQWKHVSARHCWNNSIIFWHESICDSDSCSLGPHEELECPCFATPGFTVTAVYPVELLVRQSFLGEWDFMSVDIMCRRS